MSSIIDSYAAVEDLWLVVPFFMGFFFFRSKAGLWLETHIFRLMHGRSVKDSPDVDTTHFVAVRSELSQVRQEIIRERCRLRT